MSITSKADCESTISPSTLSASSPDPEPDEGIECGLGLGQHEARLAARAVARWRLRVEAARTRMVRAAIFYSLNLKVYCISIMNIYISIISLSTQVSAMQQWKEFARRARSEREVREKERQLEQVSCDWWRAGHVTSVPTSDWSRTRSSATWP